MDQRENVMIIKGEKYTAVPYQKHVMSCDSCDLKNMDECIHAKCMSKERNDGLEVVWKKKGSVK